MEIIDIARMAHEVNRAYCQALGDNSQPRWDDAPEWQRESVIVGIRFIQENPNAPCFVPYGDLPPEQRAKDYIFRAIAREGLRFT